MEYSVIENELFTHAVSWMNLKIIVLRERSQTERNTDFVIPVIKNSSRKFKVSCRKYNSDCLKRGDEDGED